MKLILIILAFTLLALAFLFSYKLTSNKPNAVIDGIFFKAEIAKAPEQKEKGLAKYNKIDDNFIMIFPFEKPGLYTFWMKNMKFPIDIIYVRKNKIVDIFRNIAYPKTDQEILPIYKSTNISDTVLEINSGLSNKYKFKKGDLVTINY